MSYDDDLADRVRVILGVGPDRTEKRMFGGLAFLLDGRMAVAANRRGQLMVRCDPAESEALVAEDGVERMVMRGREMRGWLQVASERVAGDDELRRWVDIGATAAGAASAG